MTATNIDAAERIRRSEFVRDSKAALARGETLEARTKQREKFANEWAAWFRQRMDRVGCDDPTELLPDAMARLQSRSAPRHESNANRNRSVANRTSPVRAPPNRLSPCAQSLRRCAKHTIVYVAP